MKKKTDYTVKPGFHTRVNRTHNNARCLSIHGHQCPKLIPAFAVKACLLETKSHMLNFCEASAAICCDCDMWEPITQDTNRFSVFRKKSSKAQNKKHDFRKVVIFNSIPDALRDLHTSRYKRPRNKPDDGCL